VRHIKLKNASGCPKHFSFIGCHRPLQFRDSSNIFGFRSWRRKVQNYSDEYLKFEVEKIKLECKLLEMKCKAEGENFPMSGS